MDAEIYHSIMKLRHILILLVVLIPRGLAEGLPDLGDISEIGFSPLQERRLGDNIMREARQDPALLDDAESVDYLNALGARLAARSGQARQDFEFFFVKDGSINAFALPGGYIGVNTGLLLTAQGESEVAGVLAHEIAHVTQRHIARLISAQKQTQWASIAAMAVAILASRSGSQVGSAAAAFGQAGLIQSSLNFTRENEREADRVGLAMLDAAGFDPRAMADFFERLQRATRYAESGPSYLRTHPLTFERIADVQNRLQAIPYRQVADGLDFQLIRARLRAILDAPREARVFFEQSIAERKFLSEAAARYGLSVALMRLKDPVGARRELDQVRKLGVRSPIVENQNCRLIAEAGDRAGTATCYEAARKLYPNYRSIAYDYADALLSAGRPAEALRFVDARLQLQTEDVKLYSIQARAYAQLDKRFAHHRALAEVYARQGNYREGMEQLRIALKSGDGDFYQLSAAEARMKQLRVLDEEMRRDMNSP